MLQRQTIDNHYMKKTSRMFRIVPVWMVVSRVGSALVRMLMSLSKLVELYFVIVISSMLPSLLQMICTKSLVTIAFTFTFSSVIVVSDLNKNIGGSTDLAKKRHESPDLHTPIHPPSFLLYRFLCYYSYTITIVQYNRPFSKMAPEN